MDDWEKKYIQEHEVPVDTSLVTKPNEYAYNTPSPYIGKYPKMAALLGAEPTALTRTEILKRLSNYSNATKEPAEFEKLRRTQSDIANAYADDVMGSRDMRQLNSRFQDDFGLNEDEKKRIETHFINNDVPLNAAGFTELGSDKIPVNVMMGAPSYAHPIGTLFHELRHAYDHIKNPKRYHFSENPEAEFPRGISNPDILNLSNFFQSSQHHDSIPQKYDQTKDDPALIMYPFDKIGYQDEPSLLNRTFASINDLLNKR